MRIAKRHADESANGSGGGLRLHVRWQRIRKHLRSALWPAPTLTSLLALALASTLLWVDRMYHPLDEATFLLGGGESARQLVSTVASAMLNLVALVFSITVLALQLASAQFSPRAIRTFLRDRITKAALGVFVGTFVYSMVVLSAIRTEGLDFVPVLSVWTVFAAALASVAVFIRYVDRMSHSIRAATVLTSVGDETRESISRMFPDVGEDAPAPHASPLPSLPPDIVIPNEAQPGVVTSVDEELLMSEARRTGSVIELVPLMGDFVPRGATLFRIWTQAGGDTPSVNRAIELERERTIEQDPAAGFRQLVDIAERALSPGTCDPTTATQALDQIHDLLRMLVLRRFPRPARVDTDGETRLFLPRPSFEDFVHLAFDEILQYGRDSTQIRDKVRRALLDCLSICPRSRERVLRDVLRRVEELPDGSRGGRRGDEGAEVRP